MAGVVRADANKITQRVSGLRELWKASGGAMLEKETYATGVKAGLPDVLIAKVAFPGDVDDSLETRRARASATTRPTAAAR